MPWGDNLQPEELNYIEQGKCYVADRLPPDAVLCIRRYDFEVFALEQILNLRAGANREDLVKAMGGHVLEKGELIGLFKRPARPIRP